MDGVLGSGSGEGLLAFLDWTIEKNELNHATASALKVGCKNVLSVEEDAKLVDIRTLDVDHFLQRFSNKRRGDFKEKSLEQYRQRFRQSVQMYLLWLEGGNWRPSRGRPNGNGTVGAPIVSRRTALPVKPVLAAETGQSGSETPASTHAGVIEYPFPIRAGLRARLVLPDDMTSAEASRVAAFIQTLAFDSPRD